MYMCQPQIIYFECIPVQSLMHCFAKGGAHMQFIDASEVSAVMKHTYMSPTLSASYSKSVIHLKYMSKQYSISIQDCHISESVDSLSIS